MHTISRSPESLFYRVFLGFRALRLEESFLDLKFDHN